MRYIALNDAVDGEVENEVAPFRSLLNEMYSRDVSKKVHSSYLTKAKSGKFTGCLAPFGYRKDTEDKNGKYNYSRTVQLYPPFFNIRCSAKNCKIAPALTLCRLSIIVENL